MSANQFLNRRLVYVGTYTEPILFGTGKILQGKGAGIYLYTLDITSGALEPLDVVTGVRNPSYLAFDPSHRFLYAVNELKEYEGAASGAVSAFAVDPANGSLTFLNQKPTHGTDPCHLIVDHEGRHVFVANFMSGSVCVLPILEDGSLGGATDFIQHQGSSVDPVRQAGPHAHAVTLDVAGRFLFVPDLGLDQLVVYEYDAAAGKLHVPPRTVGHPRPRRGAAPGGVPPQGPVRLPDQRAELDGNGLSLRRGHRGAQRDSDRADAGGRLHRQQHLRRGAGRPLRPVPLRLESGPRQHRRLRHRPAGRHAGAGRAYVHRGPDSRATLPSAPTISS